MQKNKRAMLVTSTYVAIQLCIHSYVCTCICFHRPKAKEIAGQDLPSIKELMMISLDLYSSLAINFILNRPYTPATYILSSLPQSFSSYTFLKELKFSELIGFDRSHDQIFCLVEVFNLYSYPEEVSLHDSEQNVEVIKEFKLVKLEL